MFEAAKQCDPNNPLVVVDYNSLHNIHVIELCRPGTEREDVGSSDDTMHGLKVGPPAACRVPSTRSAWRMARSVLRLAVMARSCREEHGGIAQRQLQYSASLCRDASVFSLSLSPSLCGAHC